MALLSFFGASPARGDIYSVSHTFTFSATGGVISAPDYVYGANAASSPGGIPDQQTGSVILGPGGGSSSAQAISNCPGCNATSNSSVVLNPFTIGGGVSAPLLPTAASSPCLEGLVALRAHRQSYCRVGVQRPMARRLGVPRRLLRAVCACPIVERLKALCVKRDVNRTVRSIRYPFKSRISQLTS